MSLMWPGKIDEAAYEQYIQAWHDHKGQELRFDGPGSEPRVGYSMLLALKNAIIYGPRAYVALALLVIAAAAVLAACSLTERMTACLYAYTLVIVLTALAAGPAYLGSKPRFLLPAMLLSLPLARLLAAARTWVLIPVIAVSVAASTWLTLYLMSVGWAP